MRTAGGASGSSTRLRPVQSVVMSAVAAGGVTAAGGVLVLAVLGLEQNKLLLGTLAVATVAIVARALSRISVEVDDEVVVVVNTWRTHRVAWAAVDAIDLAGMLWPSAAALLYVYTPLRVTTRDGRTIYIQGSIADFQRIARALRSAAPPGIQFRWGFSFDRQSA